MFRKTLLVILIAICVQGCLDNPIRVNDITNNSIDTSKMAFIKEGPFMMGSYKINKESKKEWKEVYLSAYFIDKYEVTIGEYEQFQNESGHSTPEDLRLVYNSLTRHYDHNYPEDLSNYPVIGLTYQDANTYAKYYGKRLPTEDEWEKAARGGIAMAKYSWGNDPPTETNHKSKGNFNWYCSIIVPGNQYLKYLPVGMSDPNNFGLYDITGNVSEAVYNPNKKISSLGHIAVLIKGANWKSKYGCKHRGIRTDQINIGLVKSYWSDGGRIGGFRCVVSIEDILTE